MEDMKKVVQQTKFYSTPDQGIALLTGSELPDIMGRVVDFCASHGIVEAKPALGYGDAAKAPDVAVRFDVGYMQKVKDGPAK